MLKKIVSSILVLNIISVILFFNTNINNVLAKAGDYYDVKSKTLYHPSDLKDISNIRSLINSMRDNNQIIFEFREGIFLDYCKANNDISKKIKNVTQVINDPTYRVNKENYNNFQEYQECYFEVLDIR